jgi:hypothetical protein
MTQRYEAVAVRRYEQNGEEKSSFTNIGVAWPMKERDGFTLRLHCLPAPVDGEYQVLLLPPKPKEDRPQERKQSYGEANGRGKAAPQSNSRDLDDEIPF